MRRVARARMFSQRQTVSIKFETFNLLSLRSGLLYRKKSFGSRVFVSEAYCLTGVRWDAVRVP